MGVLVSASGEGSGFFSSHGDIFSQFKFETRSYFISIKFTVPNLRKKNAQLVFHLTTTLK